MCQLAAPTIPSTFITQKQFNEIVVVGQNALHYKIGLSDRFVRSQCTEMCWSAQKILARLSIIEKGEIELNRI